MKNVYSLTGCMWLLAATDTSTGRTPAAQAWRLVIKHLVTSGCLGKICFCWLASRLSLGKILLVCALVTRRLQWLPVVYIEDAILSADVH